MKIINERLMRIKCCEYFKILCFKTRISSIKKRIIGNQIRILSLLIKLMKRIIDRDNIQYNTLKFEL